MINIRIYYLPLLRVLLYLVFIRLLRVLKWSEKLQGINAMFKLREWKSLKKFRVGIYYLVM